MTLVKKSHNKMSGTLSLFGLVLVVALITGVLYTNREDLQVKLDTYVEREKVLERQIEDEKSRSIELEEEKKYVSTDKYIKDVAREKLGLVDPDEVLLKSND